MNPEETYELIEKYLQGYLSEADQKSFEKRLTDDPELSEELEIHRSALELVVDGGVLQAKEKLNRIHRIETGKEKLWKWKIYLFGVLLAGLVGVSGYYYWSTKEQKNELTNNSTNQSSVRTPSEVFSIEKNEENRINSNQQIVTEENKTPQKEVTKGSLSRLSPDSVSSQPRLSPGSVPTQDSKNANNTGYNDTTTVQSSVTGIDCSKVKIIGKVDVKASCANEATGAIMINLGTIRGGVKPYRYSIAEEDNFGVSAQYNQLAPGEYAVKVKDHNGCSGILETVTIGSSDCLKEFAFVPSRGEEWEIPVGKSLSGEVKIIDKKGTTVYSSSFNNGEIASWKGLDQHGQELQAGVYLFFISYANGDSQRGHITILK